MKHKPRARWVSRRERNIWCLDFSGFGADRQELLAEIELSEAVIQHQPQNSLLVAVDLNRTTLTEDMVAFFDHTANQPQKPIHKLAIVGLTRRQQLWSRVTRRIIWPSNAKFFDDYEKAKDWLVGDVY